MRVLIIGINYSPEPTGIAPYTTSIAEGLADRGHEVRVITTYPHYPSWRVPGGYSGLRRTESINGVVVERLKHYVPSRPAGLRRAVSELSFGLHAVVADWGRPDVVLCPSPALISTAIVQLRSQVNLALQVQDLYSVGFSETGGRGWSEHLLRRLESRVARSAAGVAVIHERFRSRLTEHLGVSPRDVRVIRNWTHLEPITGTNPSAREGMGWGDEFVVLHTGAMGEKQGLINVVEAARVAEARSLPIRFVLVGDGGQRQQLEKSAGHIRTIQFLDPLPDEEYRLALGSADVLLVNERPGVKDMAVPSKLTSYFVAGRPIVAATEASSTTAEEIAASGAGVRVEPGQPTALVDAVDRLRSDPAHAQVLGKNGPVYCDRVLGEGPALDAYEAWLRELAGRR